MAKIDWTVWKPRVAYGAFAALAFLVALRWTFPAQAMKERLIMEASAQGWQIDMDEVSAGGGLLGIHAKGVKLENASGLALPIDEVTASLRLLPLLAGRRSVAFDARLYDGRVEGTADLSGAARRLVVDVSGVDLASALPLRKAAGLDVLGRVVGKADVVVPETPNEKLSGRVDVRVKDAGVAGGQLPIPGMASGLNLPRMGFGEIAAAVKLGDGKAVVEKLEAKGGDAELQTEGVYFVVQPRMEFAPIFGKARLKVQDAFWSKPGAQTFRGLADLALASSKGSDGAWNFAITGSVGHPRMMPTPPGR